jgi:predicted SAM-dependent methyltransferase
MPKVCENCEKLPWSSTAKKRCICHGFNLDLGCGGNKQKGYLGSDKRDLPNVDLVFDIENVPTDQNPREKDGITFKDVGWPIPDEAVDHLLMSHVLEHMKPWLVIDIMNEMWRVMHPQGQTFIAVPYAGSFGFWQDPTHTKGFNEATWAYFDPSHQSHLYNIYRPQPWKVTKCIFNPIYNMEVILEPRKICQHGSRYVRSAFIDGVIECTCCWKAFLKEKSNVLLLCQQCRPKIQKSLRSTFGKKK